MVFQDLLPKSGQTEQISAKKSLAVIRETVGITDEETAPRSSDSIEITYNKILTALKEGYGV